MLQPTSYRRLSSMLIVASCWLASLAVVPERAFAQSPEKGTRPGLLRERLQRAKPGTEVHSLEHAGQKRNYRLHLPANLPADQRHPVVIVLHGFLADGFATEVLSGMDDVAAKQHFLVVYPDGVSRLWRFWEDFDAGKDQPPAPRSTDDVGFISELIDELIATKHVDANRVYVCGISNGAYMSHRLGLSLPHKIAAIGSVAGSLPQGMTKSVKLARVVPVITFHGTEDNYVRKNGADLFSKMELSYGAEAIADWWASQHGCKLPAVQEKLPDTQSDGTSVIRHTYRAGKADAPVVYYEIVGGGHTWPGGNFQPVGLLGKTCRDINASELMWEFFQKHSLKP